MHTIVFVGAASSRDQIIMPIERLFFAAGSRSHQNLMLLNYIDTQFHLI